MRGRSAARRGFLVLALVGVALLGAACGDDPADEPPADSPTRTLVPPTMTPTVAHIPLMPTPTDLPGPASFSLQQTPIDEPGLDDAARGAVESAVADLIDAESIARDDVRLLGVARYGWADGALGCTAAESAAGEAGEGYRVLLASPREVFAYHVGADGALARCPLDALDPAAQGEPLPPDPIAAGMADLVRRDWAAATDSAVEDVALDGLLTVIWPDASLGCPKGTGTYADEDTPGYRIVVRAGEQTAVYHTSIRAFQRCSPDEEILPGLIQDALLASTTGEALSAE